MKTLDLLEHELREKIEALPKQKKAVLFIKVEDFDNTNNILQRISGENIDSADRLHASIKERIALALSKRQKLFDTSPGNFMVFVEIYHHEKEIMELATLICQVFKSNFEIEGFTLRLSQRIGISLYPKHSQESSELIYYAMEAIYRGIQKRHHKIWYCTCEQDEDMHRFMLTQDLYKADERNELSVFYQPQWDLKAKRISGFEALLRWNHRSKGYISPLSFIPIAEKTGLIIPIGEKVLRDSCVFLKKLQNRGFTDTNISVNISATQLLDDSLYEDILRITEFIDLDPHHLILEITETILMREIEHIADRLQKLREEGIRIAIDDFGQGYSSLAYLRTIPADILKIDKIFVDEISDTSKAQKDPMLLDPIIYLGKNMGFTMVAEGVEEKAQWDYLSKTDCHLIQGYYFSKPLRESEAVELIKRYNSRERRYCR